MIKIIYGVTNTSATCELIFPLNDNTGVSMLVNKSIFKNDIPESLVGHYFYSIHCLGDYYIFSKINFAYDKSCRTSYCAFVIAINGKEESNSILDGLGELETRYNDKESILDSNQQSPKIQLNINSNQKASIVTYYKEGELGNYLIKNNNYKQYKTIYLINEEYDGKEDNPINALKDATNIVAIEHVVLSDSGNGSTTDGKNKFFSTETVKQFGKNRLVVFLLGIITASSVFGGYQYFISTNKEASIIDNNYQSTNNAQDNKLEKEIRILKDSIKVLNEKKSTADTKAGHQGHQLNTGAGDNGVPTTNDIEKEIGGFLTSGCKTMNLESIISKIEEYKRVTIESRTKDRLEYFKKFINKLLKNPFNKSELDAMRNLQLNRQFEYVKFYQYLQKKDDNFFKNKRMVNIENKTLKEIEEHYQFNN